MKDLVSRYDAAVVEEQELSPEKRIVANVGKMDAKKHLAANVTSVMSSNINQVGGGALQKEGCRGLCGKEGAPIVGRLAAKKEQM